MSVSARAPRTPVLVVRRATTKTGVRLGLITTRPPSLGIPDAQPRCLPVRAGRHAKRPAVRLLMGPGPAYFASTLLAGMAIAFLAGLWLL